MIANAKEVYFKIQNKIQKLGLNEFLLDSENRSDGFSNRIEELTRSELKQEDSSIQQRVLSELNSWGPIEDLLLDSDITEVLINGASSVWYEKQGQLFFHEDSFFSELSYRNFIDRLSNHSGLHLSLEKPIAMGAFKNFRLTLTGSELTRDGVHVSLRRHPESPWTLSSLMNAGWASCQQISQLQSLLEMNANFLVIGGTGSGKTSVLNALLGELPQKNRVVVIEDTPEIHLPNSSGCKLLTREDPNNVLSAIDQSQLVKHALRLRPDRIVMGEVRGSEAKDFLMALSTGHPGSFGTLHAQNPQQALIRLEMLIQMGAPQWGLEAIRKLIQLSLQYIVQVEKNSQGQRKLVNIFQLTSLESSGFLLEPYNFESANLEN